MGYYGAFEFDVTIPAAKVSACAEAIRNCQDKDIRSTLTGEGAVGLSDPELVEKLLSEHFYDAEVYFADEPPALTQLAMAGNDQPVHGDLRLEGYSHQKWRQYIESTLCLIAPFASPGDSVDVQGEEGEKCRWVFDGETVDFQQSEIIWPSEMEPHEANERIVQEIVSALSAGEEFSPARIIREHRPELWEQAKSALLA